MQKTWRIIAPLVAIIILTAIIYFFGIKPIGQLNEMKQSLEAKDYLQLRGTALSGLAQALGGAILIIGLFFTWRNVRVAEANAQATQDATYHSLLITQKAQLVAQDGQITERFTRAIDHLGNRESLTTRLGGIYALERIAKESPIDHWPVMEILTAYVRENAAWNEPSKQLIERPRQEQAAGILPPPPRLDAERARPTPIPALPKDIQAILTALGRRQISYETDRYLDLRDSDLASAQLDLAHLENTIFHGVHLEGAVLISAHFEYASFIGAHLEGTNFSDADLAESSFSYAHLSGASFNIARAKGADFSSALLSKASFVNTDLERANFQYAKLKGANFENANLEAANLNRADLTGVNFVGANLKNVDMTDVEGLTIEQIRSARAYESARFPESLALALK